MNETFLKNEVDHISDLPPMLQIYYISALNRAMLSQRIENKLYKDTQKSLVRILKKAIDNLEGQFEDQIVFPLKTISSMTMQLSVDCAEELTKLRGRAAGKTDVLRVIDMILNNIKLYKKQQSEKNEPTGQP